MKNKSTTPLAASAAAAEAEAIITQLAARWPQLDWVDVLGGLSSTVPPEMVADWLIAVGCDPDAVEDLCFGDTAP